MEHTITIFGLTLHIDRVAFTIPIGDGFDVYWYGILIALGFVLALVYAFRRAPAFGIDKNRMMDVVLVSTIAAIIGARAYYLAFDGEKITSFADAVFIKGGGLAIYGGIIGAFLAGVLMCKLRKVNVLSMFDLASLGFLIGQAVGRWGNFINQEAYGSFTGSTWFGMTGDRIQAEVGSAALVHPCFLYESLWCIAGFAVLHTLSRRRKFKGEIFLGYVSWYSFGRFFIEGLRTDSLYIGTIRVSQLLALILFIASTAAFVVLYRKSKQLGAETGYLSLFAVEELGGQESPAPVDELDTRILGAEDDLDETQNDDSDPGADELGENTADEDDQEKNKADIEELKSPDEKE